MHTNVFTPENAAMLLIISELAIDWTTPRGLALAKLLGLAA